MICKECHQDKEITEFSKHADGYVRKICKDCVNQALNARAAGRKREKEYTQAAKTKMYTCKCGRKVAALYAYDEGWLCWSCLLKEDLHWAVTVRKSEMAHDRLKEKELYQAQARAEKLRDI